MNTWFLRKSEGTIFGPVDQTELLQWASAARIGPEDSVSTNRKEWLPAPQMPGLRLNWLITWLDGHQAGPYHVSSLAEMLADGELDGNETVRHVHTHQTASLLHTLQTAVLAGDLSLDEGSLTAAMCGLMRGQTTEAPVVNAPLSPHPAPALPRERPAVVAPPLSAWTPAEETKAAAVLQTTQQIRDSISSGAAELKELFPRVQELLHKLQAHEAALTAGHKEIAQLQSTHAEQAHAVRQMAERIQALQAELDEVRSQWATHQKIREEERAAAHQQAQQYATERKQHGEQLAALQNALDATLKQRAEMEAALRIAADRLAERDRACTQAVEEGQRREAQWQAELKQTQTAHASAQQEARQKLAAASQQATTLDATVRQQEQTVAQTQLQLTAVQHELEKTRHQFKASEAATQQNEKNLDSLRQQVADLEEGRLSACAQVERKEAEHDKIKALLESARETALAQCRVLQAERDTAVERAAERGQVCEQITAEKRRVEEQLRSEVRQGQAACVSLQKEKAATQQQLTAAMQRVTELEASIRQHEQAVVAAHQQLATAQETYQRELPQQVTQQVQKYKQLAAEKAQRAEQLQSELQHAQTVTAAAQKHEEALRQRLHTVEAVARQHEQMVVELRKQLVAAQAVTLPATTPPLAGTKQGELKATEPARHPPSSADLYCVPPRKVRD